MKLVQIGAGNIGRSFIGTLFSDAGWDVVFVDAAKHLVSLINEKRYYTVVIKRDSREDEEHIVGPVRAIDASDAKKVAGEIADCDLLATSVGKDVLPRIMPVIAAGLEERQVKNRKPLDIIIAENVRGVKNVFLEGIDRALKNKSFFLEDILGLVETSIGKMVPLVTEEDIRKDPLRLFAEEYMTLIVDQKAFHGDPPAVPGLKPVEHIAAWVDRKSFIHNLGHAAVAYLGYSVDSGVKTIVEALRLPGVASGTRAAMNASADALAQEYPESYTRKELIEHIDDLLFRFGNTALGDTVFRVGRDLQRKLSENDRLVGAMLLCARRNVDFSTIARVYHAALEWKAIDKDGKLFPVDEKFHYDFLAYKSPREALASPKFMAAVSGLDDSCDEKRKVLDVLRKEGITTG
jgi:mannitol-1-phosphate 5-dehydrogenase